MRNVAKNKNEIFITCDCVSEVVHFQYDPGCEGLKYYEVSMFRRGSLSLWNRLWMIWKILTTGTPYADDVIINQAKAEELANWILEKNNE